MWPPTHVLSISHKYLLQRTCIAKLQIFWNEHFSTFWDLQWNLYGTLCGDKVILKAESMLLFLDVFTGLSVCCWNIDLAFPQNLWSYWYLCLDTWSNSGSLFLSTCYWISGECWRWNINFSEQNFCARLYFCVECIDGTVRLQTHCFRLVSDVTPLA